MICFGSIEKRDELGTRLANLAEHMRSSMDQGHHHQIWVNPEMVADIIVAAAIVHSAPVVGLDNSMKSLHKAIAISDHDPIADPVQHPWGGAF